MACPRTRSLLTSRFQHAPTMTILIHFTFTFHIRKVSRFNSVVGCCRHLSTQQQLTKFVLNIIVFTDLYNMLVILYLMCVQQSEQALAKFCVAETLRQHKFWRAIALALLNSPQAQGIFWKTLASARSVEYASALSHGVM